MRYLVLIATVWMLAACQNNAEVAEKQDRQAAKQPAVNLVEQSPQQTSVTKEHVMTTVTGTIQFKGFEGGFYALDADNGEKYTPMKLDKAHMRHGLRVRVTGQVRPDVLTTTQYGSVIEVSEVVVLEDSDTHKPDEI